MELPDDQECLRIAVDMIEEYGEMVGPVIQSRIDELRKTDRFEELARWFLIRNTVGFILHKSLN
ncbi:hypothetical protein [Sphingobium sp.]|uniref:hypothetical protein n=1 Tax=Sphingobium sp. TaxID=1912891 RepID=UPI002C6F0143|nr:hypothetical protein [Sphingobium sp.]HUD90228.1 hypothetical protein [Sphingobium sp.]